MGLLWTLGALAVGLSLGLARLGLGGVGPGVLLFAALSGIVQYALAFWLYLFALQHLRASVAAFYLALIPVFGIAAASVFLGESLSPRPMGGRGPDRPLGRCRIPAGAGVTPAGHRSESVGSGKRRSCPLDHSAGPP